VAGRCEAVASESHVAQAAREGLSFGNAVDAIVAAVLVAAAESPSVLLGPLQMLVAGAGAGVRAIDGRVRQPGMGLPRPRGLLAGEPVPFQARVGVPALPAALAWALGSLGSATQRRVGGAATERARARSPERGRVFEAFARRGAAVLIDDAIAGELTSAAGRAAGGSLTYDDLASVRPVIVSVDDRALEPSGVLTVPWGGEARRDASFVHIVAAVDARGLVAIACYEAPLDGLSVPGLGLVAPPFAVPVMRGEPRTRPGEPCPAAAPIALRAHHGTADLAMGIAEAADAETSLEGVIRALTASVLVGAALAHATSGRPVAVLRSDESVRAIASG
jgi:gamma-glutamyltranspeptidase/glutathione hydrolase